MRFLLDECISARLAPLLTEAGHEVVHVLDLRLQGRADMEVLSSARDEARILISSDTDFGELLTSGSIVVFTDDRIRIRKLPI